MLNRIVFSIAIALLGVFAATGQALAAKGEDADEVQLYMAAVITGVMILLLLIYSVKWYFGIDSHASTGEPEADAHNGHH